MIAAVIIIAIVLYSFLAPVFITTHNASFMCGTYAKKPGRVDWLRPLGIATGGVERNNNESTFIKLQAIGVAAETPNGETMTLAEGKKSEYQPILKVGTPYTQELPGKKFANYYPATIDTYLEVGFVYQSVEQAEYQRMRQWQEKTGLQLIYPLIDTENGYCFDPEDANFWYKTTKRGVPVSVDANGNVKTLSYSEDLVLEDQQ